MLAGIEGICGGGWHCPHRKHHHQMILEIVGQGESISMAKYQSYVMRSATDVEVPGKCFESFVF
jgi:hypothetical protein